MNFKRNHALLAAAVCAVLFTGCGEHSSATGAADIGTRVSRDSAAETTHMTTENTTATSPPEATSDQTTERVPLSTNAMTGTTASTSKPGLIDRAESALDSLGDAITSVLTEATRPVH